MWKAPGQRDTQGTRTVCRFCAVCDRHRFGNFHNTLCRIFSPWLHLSASAGRKALQVLQSLFCASSYVSLRFLAASSTSSFLLSMELARSKHQHRKASSNMTAMIPETTNIFISHLAPPFANFLGAVTHNSTWIWWSLQSQKVCQVIRSTTWYLLLWNKGFRLYFSHDSIFVFSRPRIWEYSNCFRSKSIIASQLSVVLTEPPFRNGSFIIPAIIFAIRTDQPSCFGYRSRSAVRSLILDEYASQIRSWRHTTDLLQIAVLYLSTVYSIFKEQRKRCFCFLLMSR